ncbi:MAG: hypothetical protein R3D67_11655 [Hyphomicrobiaceae bacterium]
MPVKLLRDAPILAVAMTCALLLPTPEARADAIDGEWCRDGRHFVIDGRTS